MKEAGQDVIATARRIAKRRRAQDMNKRVKEVEEVATERMLEAGELHPRNLDALADIPDPLKVGDQLSCKEARRMAGPSSATTPRAMDLETFPDMWRACALLPGDISLFGPRGDHLGH